MQTFSEDQKAKALFDLKAMFSSIDKLRNGYDLYMTYSFKAASQAIYTEITERTFNKNLDESFNNLASLKSEFNRLAEIAEDDRKDILIRDSLSAEELMSEVAWFCSTNNIFWDSASRSPFELTELFNTSSFARKLAEFGCYNSDVKQYLPATAAPKKGILARARTKSNYKQSGPQSLNTRGLLSTSKEYLAQNRVVKLEGVNAASQRVIPTAFIRPLLSEPAGASSPTVNKVFVGSAQGYTQCPLFFDSVVAAEDFLKKIEAANKIPANITNMHAVQKRKDPNGYFKLNTEFGEAYILASKLNEQLSSDNTENEDNVDIASFTEHLLKEI